MKRPLKIVSKMRSALETQSNTGFANAKVAPTKFRDAERQLTGITAAAEKKVLLWIAARMPSWIDSDHLTLIGLVGQFGVGVSYALARWNQYGLLLGTLCLGINWFGDSLDGTLARVRGCERPRYGFYVDHIIDSFGALILCLGLSLSGYLHPLMAMALLVSFLLLSIETYLAAYAVRQFKLAHCKMGPTEIRIILAIGNIALFVRGGPWAHIAGNRFLLFDIGAAVAIAGMLCMSVTAAIRHTIQLYREEPMKRLAR